VKEYLELPSITKSPTFSGIITGHHAGQISDGL